MTSPSAGAAGIDVPELADLVYEKAIGSSRFMKSIRARHHDGVVLAKVFVKPYTPMSLDEHRQKIICMPSCHVSAHPPAYGSLANTRPHRRAKASCRHT